MGFFSRIKEWVMGLFRKEDYRRLTNIQPQIGDGMMSAINEWRDIYAGNPPWLDEEKCPKTIGFAHFALVALNHTVKIRISFVINFKHPLSRNIL